MTQTTWANLQNGGVMQIDFTSDGTYDHSVICVDKTDQKFAQHSSKIYIDTIMIIVGSRDSIIRTILEFINSQFVISKTYNKENLNDKIYLKVDAFVLV